MIKTKIHLDHIPDPETFYKDYWGKQAFIVKNALKDCDFDHLISGDELAGLALEEDVQSRIVRTAHDNKSWHCANGPFEEAVFQDLGEKNWSLLVQNCDRFHPPTAELLKSFNFSPRWLLDDIMVSFSAPGGSVGPHIDSYHVFLIQGQGKRRWKIGFEPILNEEYIEDIDLKVLKHDFNGEETELTCGDLIYIPPFVPHEGVTLENALTYSVGFLGPSVSELMIEYGHFLAERDQNEQRYTASSLCSQSHGFKLCQNTIEDIQKTLVDSLQSDDFYIWLAGFFSAPRLDDSYEEPETLSSDQILIFLKSGGALYRPEEFKLTITPHNTKKDCLNVGIEGHVFQSPASQQKLLELLITGANINAIALEKLPQTQQSLEIITKLYNARYLHRVAA